MKCKECGKENLIKAKYCQHCGNEFSEHERDEAYANTFFGKLTNLEEKIEKIKKIGSLEIITGHPVFRIGLLVLILVVGIFVGRTNGSKMTILESNDYQVEYHTKEKEYYVLTEQQTIALNLYFPRTVEEIVVSYDNGAREKVFKPDELIELERKGKNGYLVKADYGDEEESIKVFVVLETE